MQRFRKSLDLFLSIPKTLYFNFKAFRFRVAIKMPVVISWRVKIRALARGSVIVPANCKTASIAIGFSGTTIMHIGKAEICLPKGGKIEFLGKAIFARGVCLKNTGRIVIGDRFVSNNNLRLTCAKEVIIEDGTMLGWNVVIRDSDGHCIIENGIRKEPRGTVHIGKRVWVCAECHILKNVEIGNNCVVAYRSLVTSKFTGDNLLIAGSPAKIIKENIDFEWEI